ncbi:MAG: lytic transglycosylase domain-containing protein [Pseudomonadota bacterium]
MGVLPWVGVLCLWATLACPAESPAKDVFFFRDRNGVMHFTDAPTTIHYRPYQVWTQVRVGLGTSRLDPKITSPLITAAARKYNLDPALIQAVIQVESAFDPNAVSWAGARGLMQLMPSTADLMEVKNSFNPGENILGGSRYLRHLLDRFDGNLELALAAYNIGPTRVESEKKIPEVRETQMYVKRVLAFHRKYKTKNE